jgi:hypothetical protein
MECRWVGRENTRVTGVGVRLEIVAAFGELESGLGDDLIQGICAAAEDFAGIAMADAG